MGGKIIRNSECGIIRKATDELGTGKGRRPQNNNGGAFYCVAAFSFYYRQFILQGNANPNRSDADANTNSPSDGNANSGSNA